MPFMSDQRVARLETHLERVIEGAFAQLFGKTLRPHDIAVHLSRALENGITPSTDDDPRPVAPDHFVIRLNRDVHDHLLIRQPILKELLTQHMVELAAAAGCRLRAQPTILLVSDATLHASDIHVHANYQNEPHSTTQILKPARLEAALARVPTNPVLVVDGDLTIALGKTVMTIGRGRDNDIVLDDPFTSRHHAQLRLRQGAYFVFDANSQSGITVNDVPVREHRLQPGDVLRIGKTQLLYLEDAPVGEDQTEVLSPPPS